MEKENLNDKSLTALYKKRKSLITFILFLALLCAGVGFYMMTYQLLGAKSSNPDYYKWTAYQHVFNNDNSVYANPNHIYYVTAAFYGECVVALLALITLLVLVFKKQPNLNSSYSLRRLKREKLRSTFLFIFTILVGLYVGTVFFLSRIILINDGKGILYSAGLVGSYFAASVILYALADLVYIRTLINIHTQLATAPEENYVLPFEKEKEEIPSTVFDELTSDVPVETKPEEVNEPEIKYVEQASIENSVINESEETIQPMAYVPVEEKVEPKPVVKKVEQKTVIKPTPKPEPEPKPEPKPEPEPKKEIVKEEPVEEDDVNEEKFTLKEILKAAATVTEEPKPKANAKPKEKITKAVISKTLKKDYPNVEQKKRENYTTTGLPLADTHYVNTPKGKKCFLYVYETTGNPLILLKIPNYYYRQLKDRGLTINKSQFPKSKLSWSSLVLDSKVELDDIKEAINIASEFVKTNS